MAEQDGPRPGHFLPGGAGSGGEEQEGALRGSAPLAAPTPRVGKRADSDGQAAPQLRGSRLDGTGLSGSRLGPPPADDVAAAAYRAVFHPEPLAFDPHKKRSKALIAAIVVAVLLVVAGCVYAGTKLLSGSDGLFANPLTSPSVKSGEEPAKQQRKPTPDADVLRSNPLYAVGPLATVQCPEPAFRPTSKENVQAYYEAMISCLDKAWQPLVSKAGFEFRSPRLIVFDDDQETACGVQRKLAVYCADEQGGSVTMPWQDEVDLYPKNRAGIRVSMAQAIGYVYGVHLQNLTGIFESSANVGDGAANKAAELEQDRRQALQAYCFSATFFGAAKASFPLRNELLRQWNQQIKNGGDERKQGKVRDHGSAKSLALWMNRGFAKTDPGVCNTFTAAAGQVG